MILVVLVVFAQAWHDAATRHHRWRFIVRRIAAHPGDTPLFASRLVTHGVAPRVHAASVTAISRGRLLAVWYGGSREGAKDVALYSSVFEPTLGRWSPERRLIRRAQVALGLSRYIRKLGNPVVYRGPKGKLWLFFVSASVGGWSGSSINLSLSADEGETWGPPQRLITSPFLNLSTLVKAPPLALTETHLALPVYHELLGLFAELLWLDSQGHVVDKIRLSWGRQALQPVVVPLSPLKALALMRYAGSPPHRILAARSLDGGRRWSSLWKTALPNPNAAVSCVRLSDGRLLLAFNNSETERSELSLALSRDEGRSWEVIRRVEQDAPNEISYPYLIQAPSGELHLLYTWRREQIKHLQFNLAWLEEALGS